jgi:hypothetical protein
VVDVVLVVVVVNDSSSEELAPDELSSLEDSLLLLPSAVVVVVRGLAVVVRAAGTFSAGRKTLPMAMYPPWVCSSSVRMNRNGLSTYIFR